MDPEAQGIHIREQSSIKQDPSRSFQACRRQHQALMSAASPPSLRTPFNQTEAHAGSLSPPMSPTSVGQGLNQPEDGPVKVVELSPRAFRFRRRDSERTGYCSKSNPSRTIGCSTSRSRSRAYSASVLCGNVPPTDLTYKLSSSAPSALSPPFDQSRDQKLSRSCDHFEHDPTVSQQCANEYGIFDFDDETDLSANDTPRPSIQKEYEQRWILNLSIHFRDKSNREKFFVTYAETPSKWRRITVSLDYRNALEGSLESDLCVLQYQQDKSVRIFEAIKDSLPDIEYYNTVTNLKLETSAEDGQLHIHVREDSNEIIQYPATSKVQQMTVPRIQEADIEFLSHLSGFVYKVRVGDEVVIKKEIPGPDTVDEFLYEINALDSLLSSNAENVVQLKGIVTDAEGLVVKGLLISYASRGALVDMLYDNRDSANLPWYRREKWARQIVRGLSDIHEAGFVQGDFTLSNIVVDEHDDAKIIDINRRGCPVGWEPPEFTRLIESGQRIGMCIGVKTDLFQLGMVLWALAEGVDEPERVERPLPAVLDTTPEYFRKLVAICLSERPQGRISAKSLLKRFPSNAGQPCTLLRLPSDSPKPSSNYPSSPAQRPKRIYIDPNLAVTIDEVTEHSRKRADYSTGCDVAPENIACADPSDSRDASTSYQVESTGSWIVPACSIGSKGGRSPFSSRCRRTSPYGCVPSSATSFSSVSSADRGLRNGRRYVMSDSNDFGEPRLSREYLTWSLSDYAMSDDGGHPDVEAAEVNLSPVNNSVKGDMLSQKFVSGFKEAMLDSLSLHHVENTTKRLTTDEHFCSNEHETIQ